jgi:hypothetical protein
VRVLAAAADAVRTLRRVLRLIAAAAVGAHSIAQISGSLTFNRQIAIAVQTLLPRDWTENVLFSIPSHTLPDGQFIDIAKQEFRGERSLVPSDILPNIDFRCTHADGPGIVKCPEDIPRLNFL